MLHNINDKRLNCLKKIKLNRILQFCLLKDAFWNPVKKHLFKVNQDPRTGNLPTFF